MTSETEFERETVRFFTDRLGYKEVSTNLLDQQRLIIPADVKKFVQDNYPDELDRLLGVFNRDEGRFWNEFLEKFADHAFKRHNVAIRMSREVFKFNGERFVLFKPFGEGVEDKNVYSVVRQAFVKIGPHTTRKPDLGIFVNGVFFSAIELKFLSKGQTADNGRGKFIADYLTAVRRDLKPLVKGKTTKEINPDDVQELLGYFHALVHHVAMDDNEAYVLRDMGRFWRAALKLANEGRADDSEFRSVVRRQFFKDTVFVKDENARITRLEARERFLANTYGKSEIQNEILIYNFLKYGRSSSYERGRKTSTISGNGTLSYPRPNQKYGVDKVIKDVEEKYLNEMNPDYGADKLAARLETQGVAQSVIEDEIKKRQTYLNDRDSYSILLQYAPGFGKSFMLCWLAIRLKDMLHPAAKHNHDYLMDKILVISDRVDLRDQLYNSMRDMNIDPALFGEAESKRDLIKFLQDDTKRVILVNIQKFPHIATDLSAKERERLSTKRIAFLIDEIHRSNGGKLHNEMTNLFAEIMDSTTGLHKDGKKNLIIGMTATPSEEVLPRFGEYVRHVNGVTWVPFDTYTMKEAITDGFILDPTKHIQATAIVYRYDEEEGKRLPNADERYEDDEHVRIVADAVAKTLLEVTYKRIGGRGKGMLACHSIKTAKKLYDAVKERLETLSGDDLSNRGDVFMVYTAGQEDQPAYSICGFKNEKDTISAFRKARNGLMIVVDKLQTGFDDPHLHTIFLDKEVRGIAAVQLLSRGNRICKGKEECYTVDFSYNNKNVENIRAAFEKYAGIAMSDFDGASVERQLQGLYKKVMANEYTRLFLKEFEIGDDVYKTEARKEFLAVRRHNPQGLNAINQTLSLFTEYNAKANLVASFMQTDPRMVRSTLRDFTQEFGRLARGLGAGGREHLEPVDFDIEAVGPLHVPDFDHGDGRKPSGSKSGGTGSTGFSTLDRIIKENENQEERSILVRAYRENIRSLFKKVFDLDNQSGGRLAAKLRYPERHGEDEMTDSFCKAFRNACRRLKGQGEVMSAFIQQEEGNGPQIFPHYKRWLADPLYLSDIPAPSEDHETHLPMTM